MNLNTSKIFVSGIWSKHPKDIARPICLGFLSCQSLNQSKNLSYKSSKKKHNVNTLNFTVAGVAGGYCGGDLFCLEQFVAELEIHNNDKSQVTSLWIGSEDVISLNEVDFNTLPPKTLETCHQCLQECWEWNSENNYLESQQLRLYPYNLSGLIPYEDTTRITNRNIKKESKNKENPLLYKDELFYKPIPTVYNTLWKKLHQGLYLTQKSLKIPSFNTEPNLENTTSKEKDPNNSKAKFKSGIEKPAIENTGIN